MKDIRVAVAQQAGSRGVAAVWRDARCAARYYYWVVRGLAGG